MSGYQKQGWVRLHRQIQNNNLYFLEPFTKSQAWIDLFLNANHKERVLSIRGNIITIKRGQVGWSEITMSERWKWSRNKVRLFLAFLEKTLQIEQQKSNITTIINIVNYEKYQSDDTAEGQQKDSRRYTNKNDKKNKEDTTPGGVDSLLLISKKKMDIDYETNEAKVEPPKGGKNKEVIRLAQLFDTLATEFAKVQIRTPRSYFIVLNAINKHGIKPKGIEKIYDEWFNNEKIEPENKVKLTWCLGSANINSFKIKNR